MPQPNATVTNPIELKGEARGYWFFEASAPVTVLDESGEVIGSSFITATTDWMTQDYVPFKGSILFDHTPTTTPTGGTVMFIKENPSGLPQNDQTHAVPVKFERFATSS